MKVFIVDNYDSFTYNIVEALREIGQFDITVQRNDQIDYDALEMSDALILSPGPGIPEEAGDLLDIIRNYSGKKKMLGICLGQQAIAEAMGGKIHNLSQVFHGVSTSMQVVDTTDPVFKDIPEVFEAGRYHSWAITGDTLPENLKVTAIDGSGEIMAVRHNTLPLFGVQFHPESVLTPHGTQMIKNFLAV